MENDREARADARIERQEAAKREFYTALAKAQGAMKNPTATAKNDAFRSRYTDLGGLRDAVMPHLNANGFAVIQTARMDYGAPGDAERVERLAVDTLLVHSGGHSELFRGPGIAAVDRSGKPTAHGIGAAQTYARRFALAALCGVHSEKDDDGNSISGVGTSTWGKAEKGAKPPVASKWPREGDDVNYEMAR